MRQSSVDALRELGFSEMEGRVYLTLLERGPLSGYAVAKSLAKAPSNAYSAIEALEQRGAVVSEHDAPRLYRAVPIDDMLQSLQRAFERRRDRAKHRLRAIQRPQAADAVYRIQTAAAVFDRCAEIFERAIRVVLVDAFPKALEAIRPFADAAASRGVEIVLKAYAGGDSSSAATVVHPAGENVIAKWNGQWLGVSADGEEAVVALLSDDLAGVHYANWTRGRIATAPLHNGLACEIAWSALLRRAGDDPDARLGAAVEEIADLVFQRARAYTGP